MYKRNLIEIFLAYISIYPISTHNMNKNRKPIHIRSIMWHIKV